ncbi:hypothetical protein IGS68_34450 (plasmid) [Skermanella sp. TT6]|uniref:Uncharacterized protein n=1 Tax=Skermanella cutis TaxID=2775420 RepID=A0ABX7BN52_9PROT|nr:hypothetical protein [Skermanella sp. TT6]QQP93828.1 hypothetical protein IGS68_34450 [Skermanella sp. TT6]
METRLIPYVLNEILAMVGLAETGGHPALLLHVSTQLRELGVGMEIAAMDLSDTDRER